MQTNFIKYLKYKPLLYALLFILLFVIFSLISGSDGWGSIADNEQTIGKVSRWCERVSGGFLREPSNTLGNLGFIVVGLYMFLTLARDSLANKRKQDSMFGSSSIAILYASAATFLGPGSMAMHGTHTRFGSWIDNVSMIAYILIIWIYNIKRLANFSTKSYFSIYALLLTYFSFGSWFIGSRLGIGIDMFEVSIGLWICTEVLIRYPNIYGRVFSGITVLVAQQFFGNPVLNALSNISENWFLILYFLPSLIPNIETSLKVKRQYSPWFFLGFISFFSALLIWGTGVPNHPWCNPDSWLQAHMVWHLLCSFSTLSFFNYFRKETQLGN